MLRITRRSSKEGEIFQLEGKLLAPWVGELERCLADGGEDRAIRLDLASLTFCDEAGIQCLRSALRRGGKVVACSGYLRTLLWGDQPCRH